MRKGNEFLMKKIYDEYGVDLVLSEMEVYDSIHDFIKSKRVDLLERLTNDECEVDLMNEITKDVNVFELEGTYVYCEAWDRA